MRRQRRIDGRCRRADERRPLTTRGRLGLADRALHRLHERHELDRRGRKPGFCFVEVHPQRRDRPRRIVARREGDQVVPRSVDRGDGSAAGPRLNHAADRALVEDDPAAVGQAHDVLQAAIDRPRIAVRPVARQDRIHDARQRAVVPAVGEPEQQAAEQRVIGPVPRIQRDRLLDVVDLRSLASEHRAEDRAFGVDCAGEGLALLGGHALAWSAAATNIAARFASMAFPYPRSRPTRADTPSSAGRRRG